MSLLRGKRCQCTGCGRVFSGLTAFDAHQRGNDPVECRHPESIGLVLRDGVWRYPPPVNAPWRRKEAHQ